MPVEGGGVQGRQCCAKRRPSARWRKRGGDSGVSKAAAGWWVVGVLCVCAGVGARGEYGVVTSLEANAFTSLLTGSILRDFSVTGFVVANSLPVPLLVADASATQSAAQKNVWAPPLRRLGMQLPPSASGAAPHHKQRLAFPNQPPGRSLSSLGHQDHSALGHTIASLSVHSPHNSRGGGGVLSASANQDYGGEDTVGEEVVFEDDIGYQPLPSAQKLAAMTFGGFCAAAASRLFPRATKAMSLLQSLATAAFGTITWWITVAEARQRRRLVSAYEARFPDSKFLGNGGRGGVHYLEATPSGKEGIKVCVVCLHGFGASSGSFRTAMQAISDNLNARVVAVDMPGFGLTERPGPWDSQEGFNALNSLTDVIDTLDLGARGEPIVVAGHSLGGLVAASYLVRNDTKASGAILIAPAIVPNKLRPRGFGILKLVSEVVTAVSAYALQLTLLLLRPVITMILRFVVYRKSFWERGLASAYFDPSKVTPAILTAYRQASRVKGWDVGLLRFTRFRITGGLGIFGLLKRAWQQGMSQADPTLTEKLAASNKPVTILHGVNDPVIPARNSQGEFVAYDSCGHNVQEEWHQKFVQDVTRFVSNRILKDS